MDKIRFSKFLLLVMCATILAGVYVYIIIADLPKRSLEILPGLRWEYYSDRDSCLIRDGFGVIARGELLLALCDYGICVFGQEDSDALYIDLRRQRIVQQDEVGEKPWMDTEGVFATDAQTAMGIYGGDGKMAFEHELSKLKMRINQNSQ